MQKANSRSKRPVGAGKRDGGHQTTERSRLRGSKRVAHNPVSDAIARVNFAQLVARIADQIGYANKKEGRDVKDKVGKRIRYAVRHEQLSPPMDGYFVLGEVMEWARGKRGWEALTATPACVSLSGVAAFTSSASANLLAFPQDNLPARLAEAHHRIAELEADSLTKDKEIERLRPYEARHKKAVNDGGTGGRGHQV